jgi:hypothetical protein
MAAACSGEAWSSIAFSESSWRLMKAAFAVAASFALSLALGMAFRRCKADFMSCIHFACGSSASRKGLPVLRLVPAEANRLIDPAHVEESSFMVGFRRVKLI